MKKTFVLMLVIALFSAMIVSAADYSLTSSSGIWTAVDGGSSITGLNSNEVRWGTPADSGGSKSGLRFDGSGAQGFNAGDNFLIGELTHLNWPIYSGGAPDGATLKVTLAFSSPTVNPNPEFTFDFDVLETVNENFLFQCDDDIQQSGTPCDDRITFPTSYGEESFTLDDKLYTLKISGFVDTYPSGTPVNELITEEEANSGAYLVGTLSSVLIEAPQISMVSKKTNWVVAEAAPGPHILVGDAVNWEYIVQNTGNVELTDIAVVDDMGVTVTCPKTTLASGEAMTCTGEAGIAIFGQYENGATASGKRGATTYNSNEVLGHYLGIYCETGECCENYNFKPLNTICKAAAGDCDVAEKCTGTSADCPVDAFQPAGTACANALYCDGAETCDASGVCQDRADPDCSGSNLPQIATCTNTPDGNTFTWDSAAGFTSQCNEATDSCTTGAYVFNHECDIGQCGAQCDSDDDCPATTCETDKCVGNNYYDYTDAANTCTEGCACTANVCDVPVITTNDIRCTACDNDDECNARDQTYCDGTIIKQDNGKCVDYECTTETITVIDCDDDSWCNGDETCAEPLGIIVTGPTCVAGTIRTCSDDLYCTVNEICDENNDKCVYSEVDCSGNDISGVETCSYNPDNEPFTWDYRDSFTSTCDESKDLCTTGDDAITHECDTYCGAECELGDTDSCETSDGYSGTKACTADCTWTGCRTDEYCGDGATNDDEECDDGGSNGFACNPLCDSSCTYCSSSCDTITLQGSSCGGGGEEPVPEFSIMTLGLAIIGAGLGLVFLRKKQ